jgi:hypothetical protein
LISHCPLKISYDFATSTGNESSTLEQTNIF